MFQRAAAALLAIAVAGAVATTAIPEADAARTASLAESRLILDKNDIFLYPQVATEHTQLVSFEYGPLFGTGSGLTILGDEDMALGVGIFRGALVEADLRNTRRYFHHSMGELSLAAPTSPVQDPFPANPTPHTIVDLFGSMDVGAGLLGARVAVGSGGQRQVTADDDEIANAQTFGSLTVGYSMVDDFRLDTSLKARFSSGSSYDETQEDDFVNQGESSSVLVGVSARGYVPLEAGLETGFLADIGFHNESGTDLPDGDDPTEASRTQISLLGGAGPVYRIDGSETTIATYGVLGHYRQSFDPDVDEADTATFQRNTVIPGVHLAADIELFEWLFFRSGLQYNYGFDTEVTEVDDGDETLESTRLSNFGWRAGLGFQVHRFTLDAAFQAGFVTGGPDFIGGNADGAFTMVSAGYRF